MPHDLDSGEQVKLTEHFKGAHPVLEFRIAHSANLRARRYCHGCFLASRSALRDPGTDFLGSTRKMTDCSRQNSSAVSGASIGLR